MNVSRIVQLFFCMDCLTEGAVSCKFRKALLFFCYSIINPNLRSVYPSCLVEWLVLAGRGGQCHSVNDLCKCRKHLEFWNVCLIWEESFWVQSRSLHPASVSFKSLTDLTVLLGCRCHATRCRTVTSYSYLSFNTSSMHHSREFMHEYA